MYGNEFDHFSWKFLNTPEKTAHMATISGEPLFMLLEVLKKSHFNKA